MPNKYINKYTKYKKKYIELKDKTLLKLYFDFKDKIQDEYVVKNSLKDQNIINKLKRDINSRFNDPGYVKLYNAKYPGKSQNAIVDIVINKYSEKLEYVYYFYLIKIKNFSSKIENDDIVIKDGVVMQIINDHNDIYIQLYVKYNTTELNMCIPKSQSLNLSNDSIEIYESLYNTTDTFMTGKNKIMKHIYQVMEKQYYNRIQFPNITSNIIFHEIVSNKLDYYQYFIDNGLIPKKATKIVKFVTTDENDKKYKKYLKTWDVIKTPYSSVSECVFVKQYHDEVNFDSCFTDEGIILQKYNKTLSEVELKCHVVNGEILYIMIRKDLSSDYNCVITSNDINHDLVSNEPNINKILDGNRKKIKDVCKTAFYKINELYQIKIFRRTYEMKKLYVLLRLLLKPHIDINFLNNYSTLKKNNKLNEIYKKQIPKYLKNFLAPLQHKEFSTCFECIFTSFIIVYKINKLDELKSSINDNKINKKINKLINLYKMTDAEFKNNVDFALDKKYIENYMRIDLGLPYKEFDSIYVNEIEPYACGKGSFDDISKTTCKDKIFGNPNIYLLNSMIKSNILNNRVEFKKIKCKVHDICDL